MFRPDDFGSSIDMNAPRVRQNAWNPGPLPPKRIPQGENPKGYNGSGLNDITPPGPPHPNDTWPVDTFGGAGGPMPIPDGGPGWRRGLPAEYDMGGGGFNPMGNPHGFSGDQNGGGGGPMPMPPPWKGKNPEDFGVTMEFGGPGAVNPVGMGPQDLRDFYNPRPMPPRPNPQMSQPPAWANNPGMGGGLVDSWNGPTGDQDRTPTPMPFPPRHQGFLSNEVTRHPREQPGQSAYMGGPGNRGTGGQPQHWSQAAGQTPQSRVDFLERMKNMQQGGFQWRKPYGG